jgi:hypothetical protein
MISEYFGTKGRESLKFRGGFSVYPIATPLTGIALHGGT